MSGVRVATRVAALYATLDAIRVVPCLRVKFAVAAAVLGSPVTASLKVTVSGVRTVVLPRAMPVDPVAGFLAVTVGTDTTGAAAGVTAADRADGVEAPAVLIAATSKV